MRKWASLLALLLASLACNLDRIVDPSLPTATSEAISVENSSPTADELVPESEAFEQDLLVEVNKAFFYGDWDSAFEGYQQTFESSENEETKAEALLGMARVSMQREEWAGARDMLSLVQENFPSSRAAHLAHYHLAQVHMALEDFSAAEGAYRAYLEQGDSAIRSQITEWRGDLLFGLGEYEAAKAAYQEALGFSRLSNFQTLQSKIGDTHVRLGDYQSAILAYQDLYVNTSNDYLKSQMDYSMGQAYLQLGDTDQAYRLYLDAVENYPLAYYSYLALVKLVNAGVEVSELDRGLVDYFAAAGLAAAGDTGGASELYSLAIAAFDRHLLANPKNHGANAHHYRALSLRALGENEAAIREWLQIINDHALENLYQEAYAQKARTEWAFLSDYEGATQTLLEFVTANPGMSRAAEFLFTAGEIAKLDFDLDEASGIWDRLARDYPNSDYAYPALFSAGIAQFRSKQIDSAETYFRRALDTSLEIEDRAQAFFWLAKVELAKGNNAEANGYLELAASSDPSGYYSVRAEDLLTGVDPFSHIGTTSFGFDFQAERLAAEEWMLQRFGLDPDTDFFGLGELAADDRVKRGLEFWELGEYELARAEFESLRLSNLDDPLASYRLANFLAEMGLYRSGIFAARQVLNIAGMSDAQTLSAPIYFNRLRFGTYFLDLINEQAREKNLDPFILLSVMRQESLFEGFVTSSAGARGLMQIVPATGLEIATLSGWPLDYQSDDLYRPIISIAFGSSYLQRQRSNFDGDLFAALAAYNGGPGNAAYWLSISNGDPDLFVEVIDFDETQNYVKSIYELFSIYSDLYSAED